MKFPTIAGVFLSLAFLSTSSAKDLAQDLQRLNKVTMFQDEQPQENDSNLIKAFEHYQFQCVNENTSNPDESSDARKKFDAFIRYFNAHSLPDKAQAKERLALLEKAIKGGSWRAEYVDLIWQIWDNRNNPAAQPPLIKRLASMAQAGIPIAIYGYVKWLGGFYEQPEERYRLLKAAIDRGSPEAMTLVGGEIASRSIKLRSLGKNLLTCARKQGESSSYESLGKMAWQEGRWVDAYRIWEEGTNKGCKDCIKRCALTAGEPRVEKIGIEALPNQDMDRAENQFV